MPRFPDPAEPPATRREALAALAAATLLTGGAGLRAWAEDPPPSKAEHEQDERDFVARVNAAIDKGQAHLLRSQLADGMWVAREPAQLPLATDAYGEQALVLLALAKTGIKASAKPMQAGLSGLERAFNTRGGSPRFQGVEPGHRTYAAACWAMLLDALYVEHPAPGAALAKPKMRLPPAAREVLSDINAFFVRTQRRSLWRYPGPAQEERDLSATQYALMALLTAGRLGIHVEPPGETMVYRTALAELLAWQAADGPEVVLMSENPAWEPGGRYPRFTGAGKVKARGWPYVPKGTLTGSMTCAGVSSLAVIKDRLGDDRLPAAQALTRDERLQIDRAILGGLAWLAQNFDVTQNPGAGASWHYYYLYGMERACSLLGVRHLGTHDWYREGADYLIAQQKSDGAWTGSGKDERLDLQSAFALLFLKRATVPTRFPAPAITGG